MAHITIVVPAEEAERLNAALYEVNNGDAFIPLQPDDAGEDWDSSKAKYFWCSYDPDAYREGNPILERMQTAKLDRFDLVSVIEKTDVVEKPASKEAVDVVAADAVATKIVVLEDSKLDVNFALKEFTKVKSKEVVPKDDGKDDGKDAGKDVGL